ncbi:MAG: DUF86 domain-containing protein [Armatimonadetes bacterium]|nr:DUF86 domain-containing protein [Armatimonadota bacterium]
MRECLDRIIEYTGGGRVEFMDSPLVQDGVARNLHLVAESSQRVSQAFKLQHPLVDWRGLSAFRNVMVHDYLAIDLDEVWDIVERDVPFLQRQLEEIVPGGQDR